MPRIALIICSGGCLLSVGVVSAQDLPKRPTVQQVIGYQMQQQKTWNLRQLPRNSVLYKFNQPVASLNTYTFNLKKEKPQVFHLSPVNFSSTPAFTINNSSGFSGLSVLKEQLLQQRRQYIIPNKERWWKDALESNGSSWLREILIQSRGGNIFYP